LFFPFYIVLKFSSLLFVRQFFLLGFLHEGLLLLLQTLNPEG
jgi:hypothetical protein